MTIYEVKQKAVDALGAVDTSKLTLMDLGSYVQILNMLNGINEPDNSYLDTLKTLTGQLSNGCACQTYPSIGELS